MVKESLQEKYADELFLFSVIRLTNQQVLAIWSTKNLCVLKRINVYSLYRPEKHRSPFALVVQRLGSHYVA